MPRLFVPNVEEALSESDLFYPQIFAATSAKMYPRFLAQLHPGDVYVTPSPIEPGYGDYMSRILKLGNPKDYIICLNRLSSQPLADIILQDQNIVQRLSQKCQGEGWSFDSFYQSVRSQRLADSLHLPTHSTAPELIKKGLIEAYNDKLYFKRLAKAAGIPTVPGSYAHRSADIGAKIKRIGKRCRRLMLRKVKYAGGSGNVAGSPSELIKRLGTWHNAGTVLVEPFLNINHVAGSLVKIEENHLEFCAIDRQIIIDGHWRGFVYPFYAPGAPAGCERCNVKAIEESAMKLASLAHQAGVRGLMNLDWAFTAKHPEQPIALECNFRHNGLSYIVSLANSYFGSDWRNLSIACREAIPCNFASFTELHAHLSALSWRGEKLLIDNPGAERGLIVTNFQPQSEFSLAIFGPDQSYLNQVWELLNQSLD